MKKYTLKLAFKGTNYHGWQMQENAHTVQAEVQKALSTIFQQPIECIGCGRTDTGVHATTFFGHFETAGSIPDNFLKRTNSLLPNDIAIYEITEVVADFHARFSAISRSYEYTIIRLSNPFLADTAWLFQLPVDIFKMNEAAKLLLSYEDFEAFSKVHTDVNNFRCQVTEAYWAESGDRLVFRITANRFLRNMVRAIVGTLMEVGKKRVSLEEFKKIIESRNRNKAGESVPAKGLSLVRVAYPD